MIQIWEPALGHIVHLTESSRQVIVNEIWSVEAVNHGDSALINAGKLGEQCEHTTLLLGISDVDLGWLVEWAENSRDIINFLHNFLPEPSDSSIPLHLPRVPESISSDRRQYGFAGRRMVGLGHSAGATGMSVPYLLPSVE